MTTANQVKEYKELDLSKLKDLKLFLDSATDVYENAGEFFVVAKEENFKSLDMDDISGSEIFRTLKLKMDSLKEIVTEFREVLIPNGGDIPDERIDEVQKIYNEMIALRDIVWDTYELKDEKLDLSEPKEIVSRHDDDKQEMELIVQKANALLEKVSDTENISCHTLQKITDLFEQIKEVELGYSGNKNTLRALYEEMSEFIEEHQNDFEVVCDISLDEYVPIQKRKTMEIKPDDNEGSISIKVAKDAVDAIASKKPKEINHSLVNNNINRDEASVVAKTESVDPINVVIANKTPVEESPQRFRKESPFVNKYIKDDRYLEVIKRNYNSLAIFEKHAKNIASQIEARTLDAFERWLGESHASAFLFLKNKMLFEIEELVQARDTRKVIKEEGIKYETFVTWIDLIPEMQSVVGYEKNMKFGELFIRWIVESHI